MKKIFTLVLIGILTLGAASVALAGPNGDSKEIDVTATVGPYAKVVAQKLEFKKGFLFWTWWKDVPPLMDFGWFVGAPGENKVKDTNCFVVETNAPVTVTFDGTPLTNGDYTLPTTYWAFFSKGYDDDTWPILGVLPEQLVPCRPIGFFGSGDTPVWTGWDNFEVPEWEDALTAALGALAAWDKIWPTNDHPETVSVQLEGKGIYPFQVFGFAGTRDTISGQAAGEYNGLITLTVSAAG